MGRSIANNWMIGNRNDTGTRRGFIYTYRMRSGYTHGVWYNGKIWKRLDRKANDFRIECLKGTILYIMAVRVVEFSNGVYKIRKIFA